MQPDNFGDLLNPRHWVDPEPGQPGYAFLAMLVVAIVVLAVALYIRWRRRTLFAGDRLKIRLAHRWSEAAIWVSGFTLFFVAMRFLNVPYLAMPLLLYLTGLTALGLIGYAGWYLIQRYPAAHAAYAAERERARYLPTPGRARASAARPAGRRGAPARRR